MGTVSSSLNPGVANLLQTLTNANSPLVNSTTVVSALEKAPASDIVQLSEEAIQLQGVDALFGSTATAPSNMETLFGIPVTTSTTSPVIQALQDSGVSLTPAQQAANDQANSQASIAQGLFGNTAATPSGILFNTLG